MGPGAPPAGGARRAARRGNPRRRKIWISLWATGGGLVLISAAGYWLERARDTDLKDPSAGVTATLIDEAPASAPALLFRDRAAELGISMRHGPGPRRRTLPEDTGSGLAWGDYDGDGDFDLYLVNFPGPLGAEPDPRGTNRLYRNDGERFVDVTVEAGVGDLEGFGMGASFADFDDDGALDLMLTNYGTNRLLRNLGNGRFEEAGARLGLGGEEAWSIASTWGDYDRDGRLDLYVTNYVELDPAVAAMPAPADPNWRGVPFTLNPNAFDPQPNRLYHQLPDGRFEEVGLELGVSNYSGRSLAASFVDLDGDGWLDLYVANDVSPNALLRNRTGELGAPIFDDWSALTGSADPRGSMGISVADLLGPEGVPDGLPELFITHWVAQENALYQAVRPSPGRLEYRDKVRQLRLGEISTDEVGWGSGFVDLDLDGRLDLVVANGSTLENGGDPPRLVPQALFLFWNGGERFYDLAAAAGLDGRWVARGLAAADFDGDGDSDLAVSVNRGQPLLLRNDSPREHLSLAVRLEGPAASAFGARVELEAGGRRQIRFWGADVSYASCHAAELVFGLGDAAAPGTLHLTWADGRRVRYELLPAAGRLVVRSSSAKRASG